MNVMPSSQLPYIIFRQIIMIARFGRSSLSMFARAKVNKRMVNLTMRDQPYATHFNTNKQFFSEQRRPISKQQAFQMQTQKDLSTNPNQKQGPFQQRKFGLGTFLAFLALSSAGAFLYFFDKSNKKKEQFLDASVSGMIELTDSSTSSIKGEWTLIDTNGRPISSTDLYGYYYLVLFGFLNSPEAIPNTLYHLATIYRVIKNIPQGALLKLKVVFISFDPDRDKPKDIKKYLANFHKSFIGVTGVSNNDPELVNCLKSFKVIREQVPTPDRKQPYTFDHSLRVYLMDSEGNYIDYLDLSQDDNRNALYVVNKVIKRDKEQKHRSDFIIKSEQKADQKSGRTI